MTLKLTKITVWVNLKNIMVYEIAIEPDLDYLREKALHHYARIPYVRNTDLYSYVDVNDAMIKEFTDTPGIDRETSSFAYDIKNSKITAKRTQAGFGLKIKEKSLVRFEYRGYDFFGPKHFPKGAKCCYEFILNKKHAWIHNKQYYQALMDLQKSQLNYVNTQGEVISMCVYLFNSTYEQEKEKYFTMFNGNKTKFRYDGL